jgi:SAM-dependent methyltransferase
VILSDYLHLAHRIDRAMARRYCPELVGIVLDVGCGRQPYRRFLGPGTTYIGMEMSAELEPDIVGSVLALPVRSGSLDGILCNEVLEHVPEPGAALAEMHRALRPSGRAYLTVPQSWGLHYEPQDYYRYTKYGITYLLEKHGFRVRSMDRMGGLFSYTAVRLLDLLVTGPFFGLCDRIGLRRGRYRLAALLVLPLNLVLIPIVTVLDRLDATNAYGWAVLADKAPVREGEPA